MVTHTTTKSFIRNTTERLHVMHYLLIGAYDSDEPYRAVLAEYRQRVERVMLDFFNEFDLM